MGLRKGASFFATPISCSGLRVSLKDLRIRQGSGKDTAWTGKYVPPGVYTIVEVKEGNGSDAGWGRPKSGKGWIVLSLTETL